jgi:hypothetical protein
MHGAIHGSLYQQTACLSRVPLLELTQTHSPWITRPPEYEEPGDEQRRAHQHHLQPCLWSNELWGMPVSAFTVPGVEDGDVDDRGDATAAVARQN